MLYRTNTYFVPIPSPNLRTAQAAKVYLFQAKKNNEWQNKAMSTLKKKPERLARPLPAIATPYSMSNCAKETLSRERPK